MPLVLAGAEKSWTELAGVSADVIGAGESRTEVSREAAGYASRVERAGGAAGFVLLAAGRGDSSRFCAGRRMVCQMLDRPLLADGARRDARRVQQVLRELLPQRLAAHLAEVGAPAGWTNAALEAAERKLRRWEFHPSGDRGIREGRGDGGRRGYSGLEFAHDGGAHGAGAVLHWRGVDVTGHLGGFNFQWAWASAVAAASSL